MERLDQVVVGAGSESLAAGLSVVLGQKQDRRRVRGRAVLHPQAGHDGEPVQARQVCRYEHQGRPLGSRQAERVRSLAGYDDLEAGLRQRVAQRSLHGRVGIDHEDPDGHCYT